ncbi:MAG: hypothetical protein M1830_001651 [Pleopsidium flavum]|nr:MAG: hypothetical protein M1830_001651 [Pleopsidium flavum]
MAVIWVQQWFALPVIAEEPQMGDRLGQEGRQPKDPSNVSLHQARDVDDGGDYLASGQPQSNKAPYEVHLQAPTPQQRPEGLRSPNAQGQASASYGMAQSQRPAPFNMGGMAGALPEYQPQAHSYGQPPNQQRFPSGPSTSALVYQLQQISQFAGQTAMNNPAYNPQYAQQYPGMYQQGQQITPGASGYGQMHSTQQSHSGGPSPIQPQYPGTSYFPQQHQQQFLYYPSAYTQQIPPAQTIQGRAGPYPTAYDRRSSLSYGQGNTRQDGHDIGVANASYPSQGGFTIPGGIPSNDPSGRYLRPGSVPPKSRGSSDSSPVGPSIPRGPPRKPKQSGHALWVGNLPPGTNVVDLKDHFSREATKDIESVFLISKSNCAFVNYRTEAACSAAMSRFHDSRFHGVRLVCRLRRNSTTSTPGVPSGPAASFPPAPNEAQTHVTVEDKDLTHNEAKATTAVSSKEGNQLAKASEKFFIVKSLTVEDLELSVRNGIWATQAHNEAALNKAFESADNVYLIFSANKSGEYFGYARMTSTINEESSASIEWAPRAEATIDDPDLPRAIPTNPTEFAPKGRIIDDSARGTIFWEAEQEEQEELSTSPGHDDDSKSQKDGEEGEEITASATQTFGKPFKIEWISTNRLPFYRTRGLRNPWNANREVKIARDGTELETSVGKRLLQMFHRSLPAPSGVPPAGPAAQSMHMSMHMGYPPMRPY